MPRQATVLAALLATFTPACAAAGPARSATGGTDPRLSTVAAMQAELDRTASQLVLDGYDLPYFVSFTLKDLASAAVTARFGAVTNDDVGRDRQFRVRVRVGSYDLDNGGVDGADYERVHTWEADDTGPLDDNPTSVRATLWLLADSAYKEALSGFLKKKAQGVFDVALEVPVASFSREEAAQHVDPPRDLSFDREYARSLARRLSARLMRHPPIFDGQVSVRADKEVRYLVTTEGTRLLTERTLHSVSYSAVARADDGMLLDASRTFYHPTAAGLPDEAALVAELDTMAEDLLALRKAPILDPYTGPAILSPEATGVLFHEAVGHRLEGQRQTDEHEGRTFEGQLGKSMFPAFITVRDDPTRSAFGDTPLNGHYRFDDEGVPSQDVRLVEGGVLRSYLMSRQPIEGVSRSNGHGRGQGVNEPTGRMGNLIVESDEGVSDDELKRLLLEEVRRQGKAHGLRIRDITGGSTNTSAYGYQAFKGDPRMVYKIDAKTGKETLVRGVEMVGTPLATINRIAAVGKTYEVFNGFCGAESGYVPVSTVAPAALLTEIEMQRDRREKAKPPVLPPPWRSPETVRP